MARRNSSGVVSLTLSVALGGVVDPSGGWLLLRYTLKGFDATGCFFVSTASKASFRQMLDAGMRKLVLNPSEGDPVLHILPAESEGEAFGFL